jgi:hypothetical protein
VEGYLDNYGRHRPRQAGDPVFQSACDQSRGRSVLDTPLEPVIGLAEGETRWRGMTPLDWRSAAPRPGHDAVCINGYRFAKWQGKPNPAIG